MNSYKRFRESLVKSVIFLPDFFPQEGASTSWSGVYWRKYFRRPALRAFSPEPAQERRDGFGYPPWRSPMGGEKGVFHGRLIHLEVIEQDINHGTITHLRD